MQVAIWSPDRAREQCAIVFHEVVRRVRDGERVEVIVREPPRTLEQNAKLHAMLTEISKKLQWAGSRRDVTTWKRLMTAAWLRAVGEHPVVLPAIDGAGIEVIYEPTSSMSKAQLSSLIDYVDAWGVQHVDGWSQENVPSDC